MVQRHKDTSKGEGCSPHVHMMNIGTQKVQTPGELDSWMCGAERTGSVSVQTCLSAGTLTEAVSDFINVD